MSHGLYWEFRCSNCTNRKLQSVAARDVYEDPPMPQDWVRVRKTKGGVILTTYEYCDDCAQRLVISVGVDA